MIETAFALLIAGIIFGLEIRQPLVAFVIVIGYFYGKWVDYLRIRAIRQALKDK